MSLFDIVSNAIANPAQRTQPGDLSGLLQGLQSLSAAQGANPSDLQSLVAILGKHVKSGLREIDRSPTPESAEDVVSKVASQPEAHPDMIQKVLGSTGVDRVASEASQKSGLSMQTVMALLPVVLPMVMKLLNSGGATAGAAQAPGGQGNSILSGFLDSDNDGDVDLQDVMRLASRFR